MSGYPQSSVYFNREHITSLHDLKPGARIHVIGVCGVAMAQLAILLAKMGFSVSGSDKEFYEPMGSLLQQSSVKTIRGYAATNILGNEDLVVIGNAVSYGHPEVLEVERRKLPYSIFPQLLHEVCIDDKHSIVVAGTHGKSTTSALGAFILRQCGLAPSYFVGGVVRDLPESLVRADGAYSVVEGDEYDSAFFAKVPKFSFYHAHTAVLTSIEYDHADIYPSLEAVLKQFENLISSLGKEGILVACADDHNIDEVLRRVRATGKLLARVVRYGSAAHADIRLHSCVSEGLEQKITATFLNQKDKEFTLKIPGEYNAKNALGIIGALQIQGIPLDQLCLAAGQFKGVKRRQEVLLETPLTLIEDFAHHPTAVRETLKGLRQAFPQARLWAVFEPRSNTSRKKVFEQEYQSAFDSADHVLLCAVNARAQEQVSDLFDVGQLAQVITTRGPKARTLESPQEIQKILTSEVQPGDVVVLMSNGSFGGLAASLTKAFSV